MRPDPFCVSADARGRQIAFSIEPKRILVVPAVSTADLMPAVRGLGVKTLLVVWISVALVLGDGATCTIFKVKSLATG